MTNYPIRVSNSVRQCYDPSQMALHRSSCFGAVVVVIDDFVFSFLIVASAVKEETTVIPV
jgi:hypothetical protein